MQNGKTANVKFADFIQKIEIDSLWSGKKHIVWELNPQVNILSGTNGQGKSTIINKVVKGLAAGGEFPSHMLKGVSLDVVPDDAKWIRYDMIRSLDSSLTQVFADDEARSVALKDLPERIRPRFMVRLTESLLRMLAPLM